MIEIDARAADDDNALGGGGPECRDGATVFVILDDDAAIAPQQQYGPNMAQACANEPDMPARINAAIAHAGDHADDGWHAREESRDPAEERRLQCYVMHDPRPLAAVEAKDLG